MKKSDLARRAANYANRNCSRDNFEAMEGFESGYRAARADLRRELKKCGGSAHQPTIASMVLCWLRPIR